jgi:hypothetical protein
LNGSRVSVRNVNQKQITNPDGSSTGRYVDIIIHKRALPPNTDFICFEVKKWNNRNSKAEHKDKNNLRDLTSVYGYKYGFYLELGREKEGTNWTVFQNGSVLEQRTKVFET